jgi:signal transduction histidine kinase
MIQSLRSRLVLTHLLVGGLVLVLLAISFLAIQSSNPAAERFVFERLDLISRAATSQNRLRPGILMDASLERTLSVLGRGIQATGVLLSPNGRLVSAGPNDPPELPPQVANQIIDGGESSRGRFLSPGRGRWLYLSRQLDSGQWLVLLAPRPTVRTILSQLREMLAPIWQAGLVALLASLILAVLLARWVSRPLNNLTKAAGQVASGLYDQRVEPTGPQELKGLARAFNEMVDQVNASQQSQRDFIANISHELKTPLTSISGFAQAIMDGTASDEGERRRAAEVIHQESQRLRRMVDQLLSLARFDAGQVELSLSQVDMNELLQNCLLRMQPAAQNANVELKSDLQKIPRIAADADRIAQVVINLLDNAIKNTDQSGWVLLGARQKQEWLEVSVRDNGRGLDQSELSRIFERFYQVDRARATSQHNGAGLGLAISYEIVRAHGGQMNAESIHGQGSRFSFVLPLAPAAASTISHLRQ